MLLLLRTKRGRCEAPGLRPCGIVPKLQAAFAFTAPLGLVNPMTRTHVRLLGPCFKTGRRRRRPTRDRNVSRAREALVVRAHLDTRRARSQERGAHRQAANFTHALGPVPAVRRVKGWRNAAGEERDNHEAPLLVANAEARPTPA